MEKHQAATDQSQADRRYPVAPSRIGKKNIAAYVDPAVATQIKIIAAEQGTTVQAIIEEAITDVRRKYKKSI